MSNEVKQVSVRLEPDLHRLLQHAAERDSRPLASMIRKICAEATAKMVEERSHAA